MNLSVGDICKSINHGPSVLYVRVLAITKPHEVSVILIKRNINYYEDPTRYAIVGNIFPYLTEYLEKVDEPNDILKELL